MASQKGIISVAQRRKQGPICGSISEVESRFDASRTPFAKAQSLLKTYPDELMDAHDVSTIVNSAKYDGPECIQPLSDDEIPRAG
jgi:hypothetical protein